MEHLYKIKFNGNTGYVCGVSAVRAIASLEHEYKLHRAVHPKAPEFKLEDIEQLSDECKVIFIDYAGEG